MASKDNALPFDPDQDPERKRVIRQQYRANIKVIEEQQSNPNDVSSKEILGVVQKADNLFKEVKEPQEALLDSHLLLMASNMGAQKARSMKSGTGYFDVDDFISKLVSFMGGQARVRQEEDSDDDEDLDEPLDWHKIGLKALAKSRRAPAMSFMLGPLSIEQKKRANVKRAKQEKHVGDETKPQELKEEDIQRSENETTKNVVQLSEILENEGGPVNLFKFVVNPNDFAQTVENIFYLSFLIRDGKVALETNDEGEPVIYVCEPPSDEDYRQGLRKQQMVLEFDMATWKRSIDVFNITKSMIPQRPPAKTKLGAWYG